MKPIYEPSGKAKEYGDFAINIYTGCPHQCYYCFAPNVLKREKDNFHNNIQPRPNIVEETRKQLESQKITGKLIHLCFVCDPYPKGCDCSTTREIIKLLKEHGNHVQILTKNAEDAMKDFDLLDENDWFGVSYAGYPGPVYDPDYIPDTEPNSGAPFYRIKALAVAHCKRIKTWVSCEPVTDGTDVLNFIELADHVDKWKVGKLNYHPLDINWKKFGEIAEATLIDKQKRTGCEYYIKESLRAEMLKDN